MRKDDTQTGFHHVILSARAGTEMREDISQGPKGSGAELREQEQRQGRNDQRWGSALSGHLMAGKGV